MSHFEKIYADDSKMKDKVVQIIDIYDNMKYNLEDVPSALAQNDMLQMVQLDSFSDIMRSLRRLSRKESNHSLKIELKKHEKLNKALGHCNADRSGLFDSNGQLIYGWYSASSFYTLKLL